MGFLAVPKGTGNNNREWRRKEGAAAAGVCAGKRKGQFQGQPHPPSARRTQLLCFIGWACADSEEGYVEVWVRGRVGVGVGVGVGVQIGVGLGRIGVGDGGIGLGWGQH